MTVKFDTETIRLINFFENFTGVSVKDCLVNCDCIYFIVEEGKVGIAIGKNGSSVKHIERLIKKSIKLFEFSKDLKVFIKKLIPQVNDIKIKDDNGKVFVEIKVEKKDKALVIGRDGRNIKVFKELLQRTHNVNDLIVR
ncbi:MAG TPA: NusA-like transcription termination signal-binding factor [archaeon]|nr:NusA-like transcription termination signal-binding factor [archaeon]